MAKEIPPINKKISSGPAEVIDSGTVISFDGNPIKLSYKDLDIAIIFEFKTDEEDKGTHVSGNYMEGTVSEPGILKLTLHNFDDRFGAGTVKPMPIGKYEGRRLYIQLRVYTLIGSPDKTLEYTLYSGEEVASDNA
jgi:hypothetical protein